MDTQWCLALGFLDWALCYAFHLGSYPIVFHPSENESRVLSPSGAEGSTGQSAHSLELDFSGAPNKGKEEEKKKKPVRNGGEGDQTTQNKREKPKLGGEKIETRD